MTLRKKTGGRKKGTPNKTTAALKEAILTAAEEASPGGKVGYLKWLAKDSGPTRFTLQGPESRPKRSFYCERERDFTAQRAARRGAQFHHGLVEVLARPTG